MLVYIVQGDNRCYDCGGTWLVLCTLNKELALKTSKKLNSFIDEFKNKKSKRNKKEIVKSIKELDEDSDEYEYTTYSVIEMELV